MKENGWVCETYDEFRQHYPVPKEKTAGYVNVYTGETVTFQEQERYMQNLWEDWKDEIVVRDDTMFPKVDIRNLKVIAFEEECGYTYEGVNSVSNIYEDGAETPPEDIARRKYGINLWINEAPDEVLEALGDLRSYYDGYGKYGEVILHPENL